MNKDKMKLGFNCSGTEEAFERILGESAGRAAERSELFVYLEIGIAEGTTLMAVAHYLKALSALMRTSQFPFNWTAVGVDVDGGAFFNAAKFLDTSRGFNVEITRNAAGVKDDLPGGFNTIEIHLLSESINNYVAPNKSIQFAVIDGCHGAPCVERDFLAIEPWIAPGGIVAFHDAMPEDQGGEPGTNGWQSHCGTRIAVEQALKKLGLLDERLYWNKKGLERPCWELAGMAPGDKSRGGNGFAFFRKV